MLKCININDILTDEPIEQPYSGKKITLKGNIGVLKIGKEEYLFEAVQALVKEENVDSIKLCQKLGFQFVEKVFTSGEEYLRFLYT